MIAGNRAGPAALLRGLTPWRRAALAALAGAFLTLAQPPVSAWVFVLLGGPLLAALAFSATPRGAFLAGWAAGAGFFLTGLSWIAEAFLVDIARHGWMAPFAIGGLAAGLGLFWGAGAWAARALNPAGAWRAVALAACLALAEYARSHVLTGFPWALPAYAFSNTPAAQAGALFGPHLLGALILIAAFLPALSGPGKRRIAAGALAAAAILGALWGFGAWRLAAALPPAPDAEIIRIVQPNAAQRDKWRREMIPVFFARLRELSRDPGAPPADIVIWPETAVPFIIHDDPEARRLITQSAGGAHVMLGVRRIAGTAAAPSWRNAFAVLTPQGDIAATYDKHHLVPFGEYLPLHGALSSLGLGPLVGESGGFAPGPGPRTLRPEGLPPLAAQICYEMIFPHELPSGDERPEWIVQVTNDAWFGASGGPVQHFQQARMRAIEQGLPVARAANTGISAIIDAHGRVRQNLPLGVSGAIQGPLPQALAPTPYARFGDAPFLIAAALALAGAAATRRRRRALDPPPPP